MRTLFLASSCFNSALSAMCSSCDAARLITCGALRRAAPRSHPPAASATSFAPSPAPPPPPSGRGQRPWLRTGVGHAARSEIRARAHIYLITSHHITSHQIKRKDTPASRPACNSLVDSAICAERSCHARSALHARRHARHAHLAVVVFLARRANALGLCVEVRRRIGLRQQLLICAEPPGGGGGWRAVRAAPDSRERCGGTAVRTAASPAARPAPQSTTAAARQRRSARHGFRNRDAPRAARTSSCLNSSFDCSASSRFRSSSSRMRFCALRFACRTCSSCATCTHQVSETGCGGMRGLTSASERAVSSISFFRTAFSLSQLWRACSTSI